MDKLTSGRMVMFIECLNNLFPPLLLPCSRQLTLTVQYYLCVNINKESAHYTINNLIILTCLSSIISTLLSCTIS